MEHLPDHFFILTEPGAPQADLLSAAGLREGEPNRHPGQGTANRRFFFANSMLELLYVCDEAEATQGPGKRLRIAERVSNPEASPFGVVVRECADPGSQRFPGWKYVPDYLPDHGFLRIGSNSEILAEPLCMALPPGFPKTPGKPPQRSAFAHLTGLFISLPVTRFSAALKTVARAHPLMFRPGEPHRMELIFDHAAHGRKADFRPQLPLLIHW